MVREIHDATVVVLMARAIVLMDYCITIAETLDFCWSNLNWITWTVAGRRSGAEASNLNCTNWYSSLATIWRFFGVSLDCFGLVRLLKVLARGRTDHCNNSSRA